MELVLSKDSFLHLSGRACSRRLVDPEPVDKSRVTFDAWTAIVDGERVATHDCVWKVTTRGPCPCCGKGLVRKWKDDA